MRFRCVSYVALRCLACELADEHPRIRIRAGAAPSTVSSVDGSFAVSWHEQSVQAEPRTAPTFPGFDGGAP